MRRKDREVTDNCEINKIINSCQIIRLAFADGVAPYIVPLNFGFEEKDGKRTFYFHGAKEGRKLDLIKKLALPDLRPTAIPKFTAVGRLVLILQNSNRL